MANATRPDSGKTINKASKPLSRKQPTKLDRLVSLLEGPEGVTVLEMGAALGWQAHSIRGAMAGRSINGA